MNTCNRGKTKQASHAMSTKNRYMPHSTRRAPSLLATRACDGGRTVKGFDAGKVVAPLVDLTHNDAEIDDVKGFFDGHGFGLCALVQVEVGGLGQADANGGTAQKDLIGTKQVGENARAFRLVNLRKGHAPHGRGALLGFVGRHDDGCCCLAVDLVLI
jgi:hypothetical protein